MVQSLNNYRMLCVVNLERDKAIWALVFFLTRRMSDLSSFVKCEPLKSIEKCCNHIKEISYSNQYSEECNT